MERRHFIRNSALAVAGATLIPSFLKGENPNNKINVALFILGGGVRRQETVFGDGMRHTFSEKILSQSTLFTGFKYNHHNIEHIPAAHAIINGSYLDDDKNDAYNLSFNCATDYINHHIKKNNLKKGEFDILHGDYSDVAHYNYTEYCHSLKEYDCAFHVHWSTITQFPELKNNTVLIALPDHGRNNYLNEMGGTDHYDKSAKDIFCLITGPKHLVQQGKIINETIGESIDILPTVHALLGIKSNLPGRVLSEALV